MPEPDEVVQTPGNWQEEILDWSEHLMIQEAVEGQSNRIQALSRQADGSRSHGSAG